MAIKQGCSTLGFLSMFRILKLSLLQGGYFPVEV